MFQHHALSSYALPFALPSMALRFWREAGEFRTIAAHRAEKPGSSGHGWRITAHRYPRIKHIAEEGVNNRQFVEWMRPRRPTAQTLDGTGKLPETLGGERFSTFVENRRRQGTTNN